VLQLLNSAFVAPKQLWKYINEWSWLCSNKLYLQKQELAHRPVVTDSWIVSQFCPRGQKTVKLDLQIISMSTICHYKQLKEFSMDILITVLHYMLTLVLIFEEDGLPTYTLTFSGTSRHLLFNWQLLLPWSQLICWTHT